MADADRCACCGTIIPEGSHVCPNCKVAVKREDRMDAYAYLAKYMEDKKQKKPKPKKKDLVEVVRSKDCKHYALVEGGKPLCEWHRIACAYDDFCSRGERK